MQWLRIPLASSSLYMSLQAQTRLPASTEALTSIMCLAGNLVAWQLPTLPLSAHSSPWKSPCRPFQMRTPNFSCRSSMSVPIRSLTDVSSWNHALNLDRCKTIISADIAPVQRLSESLKLPKYTRDQLRVNVVTNDLLQIEAAHWVSWSSCGMCKNLVWIRGWVVGT